MWRVVVLCLFAAFLATNLSPRAFAEECPAEAQSISAGDPYEAERNRLVDAQTSGEMEPPLTFLNMVGQYGIPEGVWGPTNRRRFGVLRESVAPEVFDTLPDALRKEAKQARGVEQLRAVVRLFSEVPYEEECTDVWKPPQDFLAQGGDCEDYAIAYYFWLKEVAGMDPDDMRLVVGKIKSTGVYHAVLFVKVGGRVWMMDSRTGSVSLARTEKDFLPYFEVSPKEVVLYIPVGW